MKCEYDRKNIICLDVKTVQFIIMWDFKKYIYYIIMYVCDTVICMTSISA